jgi:hypothetical protein
MNFTTLRSARKVTILIALFALNAAAGTLYVDINSTNPVSPYSDWSVAATNIQDAVDAAGTGDLILVNDGVYQAGGRVVYGALTNRVAVTRPVAVQSVNGPGVTVIQGYQVPGTTNGDAAVRCVYLTNEACLLGFTLTNGATRNTGDTLREQSGGGVWCETNAIVSNCVLTGDRANLYGGGAYSGTLTNCTLMGSKAANGGGASSGTLNNCCLTNNSASSGGGAYSGALNNCTLIGNSASSGGASYSGILNNCLIINNSAIVGGGTFDATLTNCTIAGNLAQTDGGGAREGILSACTLAGNSASWAGGGAKSATLSYCVVSSNSATGSPGRGGGVDSCTLKNCTVTGNSAYQGGGANGGTLFNCMLAHNAALNQGGGAYLSTIYNSALWGNSARIQGGGAFQGNLYNCTITGNSATGGSGGGTYGSWSYNCIIYYNWAPAQPNLLSGVESYCCTTPLSLGTGCIADDPQLASVSHLSAFSPCRGAGNQDALGVDIDGEAWANPASIGCDDFGVGAVTAFLSVSVEADSTNLFPGMVAMFTGNNQGVVTATRWEFDDGTIVSNQPYASHSWSEPGVHQVVLRAFNDSHSAGVTATVMVQVGNTPTHYVALDNPTPQAPYTSWSTAATNIQDAIDAAGLGGEQILVSNGVYQLGGRTVPSSMPTAITNRVVIARPLLLQSVNGPAATIIRGSPPYNSSSTRCVYLGGRAWLVGFTLTNGGTSLVMDAPEGNGGGVWCQPGAVVSNCIVAGNTACGAGGGAYGGILKNCTLIGNAATNGGGAYGGTLNNCTLVGNSARFTALSGMSRGGGGGAGSCVLNNCVIMSNSATGSGSFLFSGGGAYSCTLNNCTLSGNSAAAYGGGAYSSDLNNCLVMCNVAVASSGSSGGGVYSATLTNTILTNNTAMGYGGGACSSTLESCTLINNSVLSATYGLGGGAYSSWLNKCLIISNTALGSSSSGGGAYSGTLRNCTLTGNAAATGGGGTYAGMFNCLITSNSAVGKSASGGGAFWCVLTNCTLVGNSATSGGGGSGYGTLNGCIAYFNSAPGSANHSNTIFNYSCTIPLPSGPGNLTNEPMFVDPVNGNFRLLPTSPCINAGANAYTPAGLDLDANPRISGGTVDVGAYEFQNPASTISYAWLQQYGLPMDGTADAVDSDFDGLNNWQEWRAGTDPTNAVSVLQMLSPTNVDSGVNVTWQSVTNRSYYLQRSSDLSVQPAFVNVQSNIVGQAGTTSYTDTGASGAGPFFYRVGVQ